MSAFPLPPVATIRRRNTPIGCRDAGARRCLRGRAWLAAAPPLVLPNNPESLKFAAIGANGTGARPQYEVAEEMAQLRRQFPYEWPPPR